MLVLSVSLTGDTLHHLPTSECCSTAWFPSCSPDVLHSARIIAVSWTQHICKRPYNATPVTPLEFLKQILQSVRFLTSATSVQIQDCLHRNRAAQA